MIDDIQKHVTNAHVGTMSIQIPVEALILSPLHAPWLLVMQEWVLHQVVHLYIQDCHMLCCYTCCYVVINVIIHVVIYVALFDTSIHKCHIILWPYEAIELQKKMIVSLIFPWVRYICFLSSVLFQFLKLALETD